MYNSSTETLDDIYSKATGRGTADAPSGGNADFMKGYQSAQNHMQNAGSSQLQQNNQAYQASDNYGSTSSGGIQINRMEANQVANQQMGNTAVQSQASQESLNNPSASVNNTEPDMTTREGRLAANEGDHEKRIAAEKFANAAKADLITRRLASL